MVHPNLLHRLAMDFATRLLTARKERGLTQQDLADRVGIHVTQVRRYEAGTSAPTLDVLRNLAISLSITTDSLVFGHDERGPRRRPRVSSCRCDGDPERVPKPS